MKKWIALTLALLMLAGCMIACEKEEKSKTYTTDGFSITMNDEFYEKELIAYTYYLESPGAIMAALKEDFSLIESAGFTPTSVTLKQYAELIILAHDTDASDVVEEDGLTYFTYDADVSGKSFYYMCFVFKGADSFWSVNLACLTNQKDEYEPKFKEWAKSIVID